MAETLSYAALRSLPVDTFEHVADPRTGANKRYALRDVLLGAFSVFSRNALPGLSTSHATDQGAQQRA